MSRAIPDLRCAKRLAILHTAFIGDVALAAVLAENLRACAPQAEIHFITTPQAAPLCECFAAITKVHIFDKRGNARGLRAMRQFAAEVGGLGFDGLFVPHRSFRSTLLARMINAQWTVAFETASLAWMHDHTVKYYQHQHEVERNLNLLRLFTTAERSEAAGKLPKVSADIAVELLIPASVRHSAAQLLQDAGITEHDEILAIAPGSVWATKRWPQEKFRNLLQQLAERPESDLSSQRSTIQEPQQNAEATSGPATTQTLRPILIGGPGDSTLCAALSVSSGVPSLAGATTLPELLAILERSRILLCNDSAPTHLANLVKCPVAVLFGPTIPEFGFAPRRANDRIIQTKALTCRPCSIHGPNRCPLGTHACMHEISVESVIETLREIHASKTPNTQ